MKGEGLFLSDGRSSYCGCLPSSRNPSRLRLQRQPRLFQKPVEPLVLFYLCLMEPIGHNPSTYRPEEQPLDHQDGTRQSSQATEESDNCGNQERNSSLPLCQISLSLLTERWVLVFFRRVIICPADPAPEAGRMLFFVFTTRLEDIFEQDAIGNPVHFDFHVECLFPLSNTT